MTPKERFYRRLQGEKVDKIPNLNIVMLFAAKYCGIPYGKFCKDYRYLVEAQTKTAIDFGIDILSTMSDPFRELYDFGVPLIFPEDELPVCRVKFLEKPEDLEKLKRWEPEESTRIYDRICAIELLHRDLGESYPVLGWVEGALAEFGDLASAEDMLVHLCIEPEFAKEALEIITEQQIACAKVQIKAGADVIGIGDACASLISQEMYREFALPYEQRIIQAIHDQGAVAKLHICGNITHLLDAIAETGADIVDIDSMVDLEKSVAVLGTDFSVNGNMDPTVDFLQGNVETVSRSVKECAQIINSKGFISAGCEIPKMTPYENLKTMDQVLKGYEMN